MQDGNAAILTFVEAITLYIAQGAQETESRRRAEHRLRRHAPMSRRRLSQRCLLSRQHRALCATVMKGFSMHTNLPGADSGATDPLLAQACAWIVELALGKRSFPTPSRGCSASSGLATPAATRLLRPSCSAVHGCSNSPKRARAMRAWRHGYRHERCLNHGLSPAPVSSKAIERAALLIAEADALLIVAEYRFFLWQPTMCITGT